MSSANWSLPTLTSTYTNFVSEIGSRLDDLALGLDTTPTNLPIGAIQWKGASSKWQKWNGTAWADLSTQYAVNVTSATTWTTPRSISISGDLTYTTSINGSANVTAAATLATVNASVGTYGSTSAVPVITVNAKGLITLVTTSALASMATQSAGAVAITGGTIGGITALNIPIGTGSTSEGIIQWNSTSDLLTIGTGSTTKTLVDLDSIQSLSGKTFITQVAANNSLAPATTAYVDTADNLKANLANPVFTGTPVSTTPGLLDNSTKIATTAYVQANALILQADIGINVNLDTKISTGIFHQSANANATLLLNYPAVYAGKLEVYANGLFIYQYYHQYNSNNIYVRSKYSTGGFTSWSLLADTSGTITNATNAINATTASTQVAGTSSTAIATTAFVSSAVTTALQLLYPVGVIYSSTVATNPGIIFGFGTWVAFSAGRVAIGTGGTFTAGSTGGSADAVLPSHSHIFTGAALPPHSHTYNTKTQTLPQSGSSTWVWYGDTAGTTSAISAGTPTGTISTEGVGPTNANLPPYIVVYMWNRTA